MLTFHPSSSGLEVVGPGDDATVLLDLDIRLQTGNDRIAGIASGVFEFEGNAAAGLGQLGRFQHGARVHMHAPVARMQDFGVHLDALSLR